MEISGLRMEVTTRNSEKHILSFSDNPVKKENIWLQPTLFTRPVSIELRNIKSVVLLMDKFVIQPTSGREEHVKNFVNIQHRLMDLP